MKNLADKHAIPPSPDAIDRSRHREFAELPNTDRWYSVGSCAVQAWPPPWRLILP